MDEPESKFDVMATIARCIVVMGLMWGVGCGVPPLMAQLDAPERLVMIPGDPGVLFTFLEDGPDGDTGVLASYQQAEPPIWIAYRRHSMRTGGAVYVSVFRDGAECQTPAKPTSTHTVEFDGACGNGMLVVPKL